MWAAVTYNTRFTKSGTVSGALMAVWTLVALLGTLLVFVAPFVFGSLVPLLIGAPGPILLSLLWGWRWRAGIVFGIGVVVLVPAGLVVLGSFGLYRLIEWPFARRGASPPPSYKNF